MRKIVACLLCITLLGCCLVSCGEKNVSNESESQTQTAEGRTETENMPETEGRGNDKGSDSTVPDYPKFVSPFGDLTDNPGAKKLADALGAVLETVRKIEWETSFFDELKSLLDLHFAGQVQVMVPDYNLDVRLAGELGTGLTVDLIDSGASGKTSFSFLASHDGSMFIYFPLSDAYCDYSVDEDGKSAFSEMGLDGTTLLAFLGYFLVKGIPDTGFDLNDLSALSEIDATNAANLLKSLPELLKKIGGIDFAKPIGEQLRTLYTRVAQWLASFREPNADEAITILEETITVRGEELTVKKVSLALPHLWELLSENTDVEFSSDQTFSLLFLDKQLLGITLNDDISANSFRLFLPTQANASVTFELALHDHEIVHEWNLTVGLPRTDAQEGLAVYVSAGTRTIEEGTVTDLQAVDMDIQIYPGSPLPQVEIQTTLNSNGDQKQYLDFSGIPDENEKSYDIIVSRNEKVLLEVFLKQDDAMENPERLTIPDDATIIPGDSMEGMMKLIGALMKHSGIGPEVKSLMGQ